MAPPSLVATICLRTSAIFSRRPWSLAERASPRPTCFCRASAAFCADSTRSTSVLMSAKSLYISLTASSCCSRAARSYGARRSRATSILVVTTISPLVSRTVYVPGRTRGPCEALNATCAARGTLGGLSSIDQVPRAIPRRLPGERVTRYLGPLRDAGHRDPHTEFRAAEEQVLLDGIFLDDVRVAPHALPGSDDAGPGLAGIGRAIHPRRHVPEGVAIEGRIRRR